MEPSEHKQGKILFGVVVKTAMKDTATVVVERYVKHPKYKKYLRRAKKYLVHDPGNTVNVGDKVVIRETRPISKHKHFIVAEVMRNGRGSDAEENVRVEST